MELAKEYLWIDKNVPTKVVPSLRLFTIWQGPRFTSETIAKVPMFPAPDHGQCSQVSFRLMTEARTAVTRRAKHQPMVEFTSLPRTTEIFSKSTSSSFPTGARIEQRFFFSSSNRFYWTRVDVSTRKENDFQKQNHSVVECKASENVFESPFWSYWVMIADKKKVSFSRSVGHQINRQYQSRIA